MDNDTSNLIEAIRQSPPGTFKLFHATEAQPEVEQSMSNRVQLAACVQHAKKSNCLMEVISLRLQYMDLWLRVFYQNTPHTEPRQREFGRLLTQCMKLGLAKDLYDRILEFNKNRIRAIHGYLVGLVAYEQLGAVVAESDGLSETLAEFVLFNSGEIATDTFATQHHNRGDAVYPVHALVAHLRSRPFI
jgi:hypothetical protein